MINGGQPGDDVTGRVLDRCEFTDRRGRLGRKKLEKVLKGKLRFAASTMKLKSICFNRGTKLKTALE